MLIKFLCEGCGAEVNSFRAKAVPKSQMCAVCEWFCEHVTDPESMTRDMQRSGHLLPVCTHHRCRCIWAERYARMSDAAKTPRQAALLLAEAVNVHRKPVQCLEGLNV